jgi:hypothetical protein
MNYYWDITTPSMRDKRVTTGHSNKLVLLFTNTEDTVHQLQCFLLCGQEKMYVQFNVVLITVQVSGFIATNVH